MQVKDIHGEADLNDLRQIVLHRTGQDPDTVADIIEAVFDVIAEMLAIHDRVDFHNIGVFKLVHRAPRKGVTPDGEPWETPERYEIEFEAAPHYARKVEEYSGPNEDVPII
jgi:nucleoid DNA-binding protein